MMKECEICGHIFYSETRSRKYCDTCKTHPEQKIEYMRQNVSRTKSRTADVEEKINLKSYRCDWCGKDFRIPERLKITQDKKIFCSDGHKWEWFRKNSVCLFCGKPLNDFDPHKPNAQFCDKKCKDSYQTEELRKQGFEKICPYCRKTFVAKDKKYCSRDCYLKDVRK